MLVACRLAGLSALEAYCAGAVPSCRFRRSNGSTRPFWRSGSYTPAGV